MVSSTEAIEYQIVDIGHDGKSIARPSNSSAKVAFLDRGLPGETVLAKIFKRSRRYDRGRVTEIIESSPERVTPECSHFSICGGCSWQDMGYDSQVKYKRKRIIDSLERLGGFENTTVNQVITAERTKFYRNKMEFSFNVEPGSENGFALGLHYRGEFSKVFDVEECLLESESSNRILNWFRSYVSENNLAAYDVRNHNGYLRFVMIREGKHTGETMVNIVTTTEEFPHKEKFVAELTKEFPEIATITHNRNDRLSNIAYGDSEEILFGAGFISEIILGHTFRVYANSFMQTNSYQVEALYQLALDSAKFRPTDRVFDLYCGAGTIGICAADKVKEIVGIELEESAIIAAKENTQLNGVENATFYHGGVRETLREKKQELKSADVILVDPPRAGMHPRAVYHCSTFGVRRIVYVSCSPGAFVRDATLFRENGYQLKELTPVDMFPHTTHIELVAIFDPA
jgi:23S rRNA (uracil1939-C5)-methyltransferase